MLNLIKPKLFLANVVVPLLIPSPRYEHMLFLVELTKVCTFFVLLKNYTYNMCFIVFTCGMSIIDAT